MKRALALIAWLCASPLPSTATEVDLIGQVDPSPFLQYVGVWGWTNPATNRHYAFLGNNASGLYVIDATNPANPVPIATVTTVPRVDMKTYKHYLYTVNGLANGDAGIVDIATPSTPVVVGTFSGGHNLFIDDAGYMYVALPGLRIYKLEPDPTHPALVFNLNVPDGHDMCVIGNRLYEFRGAAGTYIWNVTNRSAPVGLGSITDPAITFHHNGWPTRDHNYLYITDEYALHPTPDITVWDIHNVATPVKVGSIADPTSSVHNCYVAGDMLAVAYYTAGFKVFDVSDPPNPVLVDSYDTSAFTGEGNFDGAWACYAYAPGNRVYISDRPNGLFIFQLTGATAVRPSTPALSISQNVPNPFAGHTRFTYSLPHAADVDAAVFDVRGARVRRLDTGWRERGIRDLVWDGRDEHGVEAPSGQYYVRLRTGTASTSRKITLLR
jgi:hypothetical protein